MKCPPFYKSAAWLVRRLPESVRYHLTLLIARLICFLQPARRHTIEQNLIPLTGPERARDVAPDLLGNFLQTCADFFCATRDIAEYTPIDHLNYLEDAYRQSKRVMVVTAHFSYWELGVSCLVKHGYPLSVAYAPYPDRTMAQWIMNQRPRNVQWIPTTPGALQACVKAIKQERLLGMVADLRFGEEGRLFTVAGRRARLPMGPWVIATRARATIVPGFVLREKPGTYRVILHPPMKPEEGPETYIRLLEHYLLSYPEQWAVLQPFWEK